MELELIPALRALGIGLIAYSPLHAGRLTGVIHAPERTVSSGTRQYLESHRDQLEAHEELCQQLGATPSDVALARVLRNPVVSTAVVGATSPDELRADLTPLALHLDNDATERLDQIWAGPGEAPQAYAW